MSHKDGMEAIFKTFQQSINDMNDDKAYFQKKMETLKEIGEAMSDYIKELNESGWGTEESEDLTKISTKQIEVINKFEKQIPSIMKVMKGNTLADKAKVAQSIKDLKRIQKEVKDKKIQIKIANPNTPLIKLNPIQKFKYRKRL